MKTKAVPLSTISKSVFGLKTSFSRLDSTVFATVFDIPCSGAGGVRSSIIWILLSTTGLTTGMGKTAFLGTNEPFDLMFGSV